jgi:DNA-binding NarL/FixJ family response regulator
VLIAGDQRAGREGLSTQAALNDDAEVAGAAGDGAQAVRPAGTSRPDLVLTDLLRRNIVIDAGTAQLVAAAAHGRAPSQCTLPVTAPRRAFLLPTASRCSDDPAGLPASFGAGDTFVTGTPGTKPAGQPTR